MLQVPISTEDARQLADVRNRFLGQPNRWEEPEPNEVVSPNQVTLLDMSRAFTQWAIGAWERGAPFPEKPWATVMRSTDPRYANVWFFSGLCRVQLVLEDES